MADQRSSIPISKELVIKRVFDVPREMVWKAWTEPKQMAKWWGPHMYSNPVCEMDVRPGGAILIHMKGPDTPAMPMKGKFIVVVKLEKLVFTTSAFLDEKGNPGIETMNTVTFTERNGKTTMKLESHFTKTKPELALAISGHKAGWSQSLDRLFALISGSPEFVITRLFDARRDILWKVYSEAEHLSKWWGPKGFKMLNVKLEFRPGGVFHYGMEDPQGNKMWGKFVYREIDAPERLSFVVSFYDEKGGITRHPMSATWPLEVLSTITFFEVQGKTALIMSGVPINATAEERKTFAAGRESMKGGFKGTFDQLDEYLRTVNSR
jgi:uncharacterized protein YndB with AHSA1/START domain